MKVTTLSLATIMTLFISLFVACAGGDDDDDDDNGNEQVEEPGVCYIQCEAGCVTSIACMSPFNNDGECAQWGEERCLADGCELAQHQFVAGCDSCDSCSDTPDWYEQ